MKWPRGIFAVVLVALPVRAAAETVAVSPPVSNGVDAKAVLGFHQLVSSELDFNPAIDSVMDLEAKPRSLTNSCLGSTSCLRTITSAAGTDWLVTGAIAHSGSDYSIDMVLYDKNANRINYRKTWVLPSDPTAMADAITPILNELISGEDPQKAQAAAVVADDFSTDDEDDFDFNETGDPEVDALMGIDDLDDLDSDVGVMGGVVATAAPVPVPVAVPVPAPSPTMSDDEIASSFSFGGGGAPAATAAVTTQATGAAQAQANAGITSAASAVPQTGNPVADAALSSASAAAADAAMDMLDNTATKAKRPASDGTEHVNITLRGGYSKYYKFDFFTGGGELGLPLGPTPLNAIIGVELYAVQRTLPPEVQVLTGQIYQWDTIYPINIGLLYRAEIGSVRPYLGADAIMVQYYRDDVGGDWAGGGRARIGIDYFLSPNFGLNLNTAVGAWLGQNWPLIEPGVGASGVLPQISAGTVLKF